MTFISDIKVLIVDDSPLTREVLKSILEKDPSIRVIGMAENGKQAIELVQKINPDVIIMDINMPVMNGFEATEQIMAYCPTPILILSAVLNKGGMYTTFDALAAGAVDVMEKPSGLSDISWNGINNILIRKVKLISKTKVLTHVKGKMKKVFKHENTYKEPVPFLKQNKYEIIGIGASTGGPSIIMKILKNLPPNFNSGIVLVQHMTAGFIQGFVEWLGNACRLKVKLAEDGEIIEKEQVLVAPDGFHTVVGRKKTIELISGKPVNNVKPSIDILFNSLAEVYGKSAVGVLLTGMGVDGVEGLKHITDKGGLTVAQDEDSCAVFGMPKAAIESGVVNRILSPEEIIHTLNSIHNFETGLKV